MKLHGSLLLLCAVCAALSCQKEATESKPPTSVGTASASATGSSPSSTTSAASASPLPPPAPLGTLAAHRRAFHAYGKAGDLILPSGAARFVFSTGADVPGHRPLRGALLDAALTDADVSDPLLYFRQAWEDKAHKAHVLFASTVTTTACNEGRASGVLVRGEVDGVTLLTTYCPGGEGALTVHTTAENLPEGASIADELNPGTAEPEFPGVNVGWEGAYDTQRVKITEVGLSLAITGATMKAERHLVHVANELFPAALFLRHVGADVTRTLTLTAEPAPAPDPALTAEVALSYAEAGKPLPVQVLLRRTDGGKAPAPLPFAASPGEPVFVEGRVLYLPRGRGRVKLEPGAYEMIATHGPTHTLHTTNATLAAGKNPDVSGTLVRVVAPAGWTSADFHLHAAPSPDSRVSLDERVAELACMGVDFAVATDHNRITDYGPALARSTPAGSVSFIPGVEVTTRALGHFNAFPMPLPTDVAPELAVPAYWDVAAKDVFASSRKMGAKVVEVNHARMAPGIGYFDLARFDAKDGSGGPAFSAEFDALEVHNGFWLEHPDRVREGMTDLVGLARRGKHAAAVGNSDSHKLFFEQAGWPRTWVRTSGDGPLADRVIAGLLRGETTVSAGPFVEMTVDGKPIGTTVKATPKKPLRVHVRVLAPAWLPVSRVEVHVDDQVVHSIAVRAPAKDGVRVDETVDVNVDHDAVLYAWADSDTPLDAVMARKGVRPIGMTGLVWVDADGDGTVHVGPRTDKDPAP